MVRLARVPILFAFVSAATSCGGSPTPPATTLPTVPSPFLPPVLPQTYTLSGAVTEAFIDLGMPGVQITTVSGPGRASATTDESGRFALSNLLPGVYQVSFSKLAYGSQVLSITVAADTTFNYSLALAGGLPTTASVTSYWNIGGPYPENPVRLMLIQDGTSLSGAYRNNRDYSTKLTGTFAGGELTVRVDVGNTVLLIQGHMDDARQLRGVIKDDRLGGNFPITIFR